MFWPTLSSTRSTAKPEFVVLVVSCKGLPGKLHIKDSNRLTREESLEEEVYLIPKTEMIGMRSIV